MFVSKVLGPHFQERGFASAPSGIQRYSTRTFHVGYQTSEYFYRLPAAQEIVSERIIRRDFDLLGLNADRHEPPLEGRAFEEDTVHSRTSHDEGKVAKLSVR